MKIPVLRQSCSSSHHHSSLQIWATTNICVTIKATVRAIYAADTWKGTTRISHMLDVFHCRCLRTILGISWQDHITNELMRRAGMEDLSNIVRVRRLTLAGHILRLLSDRPASVANWLCNGYLMEAREEDVQR